MEQIRSVVPFCCVLEKAVSVNVMLLMLHCLKFGKGLCHGTPVAQVVLALRKHGEICTLFLLMKPGNEFVDTLRNGDVPMLRIACGHWHH